MTNSYKVIDTGSKSKQVAVRLGANVYEALEQEALMTGGTVTALIRQAVIKSLEGRQEIKPMAGDTLKLSFPGSQEFIAVVKKEKKRKQRAKEKEAT